MKLTPPTFHSLSRQLVWRFCLFTLVISAINGLITLSLMYTLEDRFIERGITQEADYLNAHYVSTGDWPPPRSNYMQLIFSVEDLPKNISTILLESPKRREFFGENGLHYHLYKFPEYQDVYLVAEVSEQLLVRPIRGGIIQFIIISGVIVSVLACLIAWFIGRRTTRPLNQLARLVDGVDLTSLPKDFAISFPKNEVGILALALNKTLKRIASAVDREQSFTRDVSHELRTPLAVIKNAVELAQLNSANGQEVLKRIFYAAEQMEKTVNTLLMLAREEHSASHAEVTPLLPVLERSIIDNGVFLENKSVDILLDDSCAVSILAEPNVLKVVLDNIICNAFKYTQQGNVSFVFSNNALTISDTGPGLQADIASSVTKRGIKGNQSSGLGLGLSIVKRLCEHQRWHLEIRSTEGTSGIAVSIHFLAE